MKINNTRKIMFLLFVVVSMVCFSPLMAVMGTEKDTVIVQLSNDQAVTTSTNVILENTPNALVVQYGSFQAYLAMVSPIKNLIIIGHGSEEGVIVQDDLTSWENYADIVDHMGAREKVLLNCESIRAKEFLQSDNVFTFSSEIDARMGGMVADMVIRQDQPTFNMVESADELFTLYDDLASGKVSPINLGLTTAEKNYWLAKFILLITSFVVGSFILTVPGADAGMLKFVQDHASQIPNLIVDIVKFAKGYTSLSTFSGKLWNFIVFCFNHRYLTYLKAAMKWYHWVLWGSMILLKIAAMIITGGAAFALLMITF